MATNDKKDAGAIDAELQATINRMKQADTDVDAFPAWDFDTTPVLQGAIVKVKTTEQIRRGEAVPVRLAIVDFNGENHILWESANLGEFFDEIGQGSEIVVIYKGMEELGGKKRMRIYDAYYS